MLDPLPFPLWRSDPDAFARRLGESFERSGFAIVEAPALDGGRIEDALTAARAFFALPEPIKRRYHDPQGAGQRGYTPFGLETAKGGSRPDLKEFWHVGREDAPGLRPNVWPLEIEGFRASTLWLYEALDAFGAQIMEAIALHLGLPRTHLAGAIAGGDSILRLLHYPPLPSEAAGVRAAAHEDINAITLLLGAEEAGLEILDRSGAWRPVAPPQGALVVNIGDMLARLTNHRLPSTTHRVVNPTGARATVSRYSTPFFLHFRPDFEIAPLAGCVTQDRPAREPEPISAAAFLRQRLTEIGLA